MDYKKKYLKYKLKYLNTKKILGGMQDGDSGGVGEGFEDWNKALACRDQGEPDELPLDKAYIESAVFQTDGETPGREAPEPVNKELEQVENGAPSSPLNEPSHHSLNKALDSPFCLDEQELVKAERELEEYFASNNLIPPTPKEKRTSRPLSRRGSRLSIASPRSSRSRSPSPSRRGSRPSNAPPRTSRSRSPSPPLPQESEILHLISAGHQANPYFDKVYNPLINPNRIKYIDVHEGGWRVRTYSQDIKGVRISQTYKTLNEALTDLFNRISNKTVRNFKY